MEEDLDYFSKNNASQPKKRKCKTKRNRTIKHDENKIQKLSNNHFLQRDQEGRLVGQFFFWHWRTDNKEHWPVSTRKKNFWRKKREIINMFWEECNKPSFYKLICKPHNFLYLNGKKIICPRIADNVWKS